jgi:VRR-NUC domain
MSEPPCESAVVPDLSQTVDSSSHSRAPRTDLQSFPRPPNCGEFDGCSVASSWSTSCRSRSQDVIPFHHECEEIDSKGLCQPWSSRWRTLKRGPLSQRKRPRVWSGGSDSEGSNQTDGGDDVDCNVDRLRMIATQQTTKGDHLDFLDRGHYEGRSVFGTRTAKTQMGITTKHGASGQGSLGRNYSPPTPSCSPPDSPLHCASNGLGDNAGSYPGTGIQVCTAQLRDWRSTRAIVIEDSGSMTDECPFQSCDRSQLVQCDAGTNLRRLGSRGDFTSVGLLSSEERRPPAGESSIPLLDESKGDTKLCGLKTTYHVAAFDFVCAEVLSRYSHILCEESAALANRLKIVTSANAKSLFVRIYRRNPKWHTLESLAASYRDVDVPAAVKELSSLKLITSTRAVMLNADASLKLRIARDVLKSLNLEDLRLICGVLGDGRKLKERRRSVLLPIFQRAMDEELLKTSLKPAVPTMHRRQMTIDGSCPARNLSRAVLRVSRVCIPPWVRNQLHRIHFLFFFEEGHDSANAILADTGKVRFPVYECIRKSQPFPSRLAFEEYEIARSVLLTVSKSVDEHLWTAAMEWGSIAELEMKIYSMKHQQSNAAINTTRCPQNPSAFRLASSGDLSGCTTAQSAMLTAPRSRNRDALYEKEAERQLLHPFFRKFCPIWVYALAAWRSVRALEALKMYESAIARLELLLCVDLLNYHRSKILDRLSINLVHLGREKESLDFISNALDESSSSLHPGELASLTRRGVRLHQRLHLSVELGRVPRNVSAKSKRRKLAQDAVEATRPRPIARALLSLSFTIPVRKLKGRALPNTAQRGVSDTNADVKLESFSRSEDTGRSFEYDDAQSTHQDLVHGDIPNAPGAKSRFVGFSSSSLSVTVEELALEWYRGFAQWNGAHSEGSAIRFIWCLLFWECALFAPVPDVFQTPYQASPLDLGTDAFYASRQSAIDTRLSEIQALSDLEISEKVRLSYLSEEHRDIVCVGGAWNSFAADDVACIAGGLGSSAVARCCELLCKDFSYWSGGLPDLVLWKFVKGADGNLIPCAKLVEVKSQRDSLSTRQRAWLGKLLHFGVDCEVCKVVEKETKHNLKMLQDSDLDPTHLEFLDIADISRADNSGSRSDSKREEP